MVKNGKFRILHVLSHLSKGGAERQMCYLVPELARMGHEVHVAFMAEGPRQDKQHLREAHLHHLQASSSYDPRLLWQLVRLIRRIRPDVIHSWILQMDILGGIATRITKVPWILREASSQMAYPPHWKARLRAWVCSGADAIVSNSAGGDAYWSGQCPKVCRRVIPNGLPLHEIANAEAYSSHDLGLEADQKLAVYVGRLAADKTAQKNLRLLLAGFALAMKKIPMASMLCGEGPQRRELEEQARELGIADRVHFAGRRSQAEIWKLLKRADVFVSLSAFEGCPNAVIEAMACECPLVVSNIPAHREFLNEQSAVFVDPHAIADAITGTLSDQVATQRRARVAKEKATHWSISSMAQRYEAVYSQVQPRANG